MASLVRIQCGGFVWYEDPKWQQRVLIEQEIMRERFPNFRLVRTEGRALQWVGLVEPVEGTRFLITVRYPEQFPYLPPRLFVEDPPLRRGSPHRYGDGSICIHKKYWDVSRGTAASCVPLACSWLASYVLWTRTGEEF
jgi:hypothetical protein